MVNLHGMVDLETWGRTPGSDLRSIGGVMFDPLTGQFGAEFHIAVDGGEAYGLTREQDTVQFWDDQSDEAKAAFADPVDLKEGLQRFSDWWWAQNPMFSDDPDRYTRFWAHGPHFDEQILAAAYRAVGLPVPWHYRSPRDLRTVLEAAGLDPKRDIPNFGTEHNALDDSKAQAMAVAEAFKRLQPVRVAFSVTGCEFVRDLLRDLLNEVTALRDRVGSLLKANNAEVDKRRRLNAAGRRLYFAGRWSCDSDVDAASLWTEFRDALGVPAGSATRLGIGQDTPSRYELLEAATRSLRAAQRAYMADRGNDELGKAVGAAAAEVDRILGDAQ